MLITYTKHEFQSEVIMIGVKWCTIVVKSQVTFTDLRFTLYAFVFKITPSFGGLFF
jgi:hypothetical protein